MHDVLGFNPVSIVFPKGTARMPQWQVDDISDLNADIEDSLNISPEINNATYNMR